MGLPGGTNEGGRRAGTAPALTAAPSPALHAEPYIMFSTDKKSLLCIRCFRDMQGWVEGAGGGGAEERGSEPGSPGGPRRESRAHCVDLESAYVQGCERLEQAVLVSAGCPARPPGQVGDVCARPRG